MSVLLFCHSLRRMGLSRKWLTGCSKLYLTLIFSVLSANICGAFSVYKTTSADNTRSSVSDQQRRLRDIHTSQYMVKDILSDYLEDDSNTDQGGDVILRDLTDNPDMKSDYPDAFQMDDATRAMELQETESPLYSRLIKVILQEDVQSPDVTIVRQKRPSYPGILGFDNLDFALYTLNSNNRQTNPPSGAGEEEVFAPSHRQQKHKPPPPGQNSNRRGWLSVGNGNTNMRDLQKEVQKMLEIG